MNPILLHPDTEQFIDNFTRRPAHAVLLVAPTGSGKQTIAQLLAAHLLKIDVGRLGLQPYFKHILPAEGKSISIETVRDITHFLLLRTAGEAGAYRVVLIENAGQMTAQAQNALPI